MELPTNRLRRVLGVSERKSLVVPIDDSLISGPRDGLRDIRSTLGQILAGSPNAVLGFSGQFRRYGELFRDPATGWIVNITASLHGPRHTDKRLVQSVRHASAIGADAIAVHVNLTSRHEPSMLETLGHAIEAADSVGLPTVAIIYPRCEHADGSDDNYEATRAQDPDSYALLISHCVRVGADLGATIVKTQYPGRAAALDEICRANPDVAILLAGGPLTDERAALERVREIASTQAAGISFGRNTYNRENICQFISRCRSALDGHD